MVTWRGVRNEDVGQPVLGNFIFTVLRGGGLCE